MEIQTITAAISSVGFPIVMCGALFWYMTKQREEHKEEMDTVKESLNANTLAIQHLTDTLTGVRNGD
jgi:hypothetical protein